jgi:hypothetical protein
MITETKEPTPIGGAAGQTLGDPAESVGEMPGKEREQSTIAFPYNDLNDAVVVARAIHEHFGVECSNDQLAAAMGQTVTSGSFRLRVAAARTFGLIQTSRSQLSLTDNGRAIVDESQERRARATAFLFVSLYSAIYERYRGNILPPAGALEREMANLGVASKQADKARQAFERSAQQAGFFEHGRNRLVMPSGAAAPTTQAQSEIPLSSPREESYERQGGGTPYVDRGGTTSDLHPFIVGLLQTLPEPGTDWEAEDRMKWLQTAANIFDLIYKGTGGIRIELAMAHRSPRPTD